MAHDVFISYASSDKAVADAVCSQLESIHRIRCWIAPRDVTPGASWAESIIDALDGSKIMVLIFSSSANASMQIEREVERAVHKGINIIPLRIENAMPTKTLEYFISAPHWLDALTTPLEDHINKLAQSVKALLTKQGALASAAPALAAAAAAAKAHPTLAVPVQPASSPAPAPAAKAVQKQSWAIPAAIAAGVVIGAAVFGARFMSSTDADAPRPATPSEAATAQPAPVAPAQSPAAQPPAAATTPPAAASTPVGATATPAATTATPPPGTPAAPAAAAVVASKTEPNLFIDFRNTLEEGTMTLDIDGQTKWTTKLGTGLKPDGKDSARFEDLRTSISIPTGRHKVTATLKTPDGKVRDTDSTAITVPEGAPRTLRVRLSRFRHHVEFQEVAGRPAPAAKPAAATQKSSSAAATAKPAAGPGKTAPAESKPAPATSKTAPAAK